MSPPPLPDRWCSLTTRALRAAGTAKHGLPDPALSPSLPTRVQPDGICFERPIALLFAPPGVLCLVSAIESSFQRRPARAGPAPHDLRYCPQGHNQAIYDIELSYQSPTKVLPESYHSHTTVIPEPNPIKL